LKSELNPTVLRTKFYISANRAAFDELENFKACFGYEVLKKLVANIFLRKVSN